MAFHALLQLKTLLFGVLKNLSQFKIKFSSPVSAYIHFYPLDTSTATTDYKITNYFFICHLEKSVSSFTTRKSLPLFKDQCQYYLICEALIIISFLLIIIQDCLLCIVNKTVFWDMKNSHQFNFM